MMLLIIFIFIALVVCESQITNNIKMIQSTSINEYLRLLPINMIISLKYSLQTIKFKDDTSNLLMQDFLQQFNSLFRQVARVNSGR